jgi:hypothetical protein
VVTAELQIICMMSYTRSSYQNNTPKVSEKMGSCFVYYVQQMFKILILSFCYGKSVSPVFTRMYLLNYGAVETT